MSTQEPRRKDDAEQSATTPSEPADKAAPAPDTQKPGLKYVFKIAPADPKRNSIDFEDVADK